MAKYMIKVSYSVEGAQGLITLHLNETGDCDRQLTIRDLLDLGDRKPAFTHSFNVRTIEIGFVE